MAPRAASLSPARMETPTRPFLTIVPDQIAVPAAYVPEPFPWNVIPRQVSESRASRRV
jgi:hypothetical protein